MDNELNKQNNFIIYTTDDGQVEIEVRLEDENVWLTQNSMAELFDTTKQNISLHNNNNSIYLKNSKIGRKYNFWKVIFKNKRQNEYNINNMLKYGIFLIDYWTFFKYFIYI